MERLWCTASRTTYFMVGGATLGEKTGSPANTVRWRRRMLFQDMHDVERDTHVNHFVLDVQLNGSNCFHLCTT